MTRKARDSLGAIDIPDEALWQAQTERARQNFVISGIPMPTAFIHRLVLVKRCAAVANAQLGVLDQPLADAIEHACEKVLAGEHDDQFPVDVFQTGSGTSTNMNVNEVLATLASTASQPIHANDHVNCSQSSNDVIPTTIHVSAACAVAFELLPALSKLVSEIQSQSQRHLSVAKTGRTHLMDAMPITLGQEFGAWAHQIAGCRQRIAHGLQECHALAIGGTAVGTGVNAPQDFGETVASALAQATGLPFQAHPDRFVAIATQDAIVGLSGALKTLAVAMTKICNDLRWMGSGPLAGLAEVTLPALQPGSSIMPGKVNPVIPESVLMVCAQVVGNDATIALAGQSGNFQLNVMLPLVAYNILQSVELLSNAAVHLADKVVNGIEVNDKVIAERVVRNPILVTALNPVIGYEAAAAIAKEAYASGRPVIEVAAERTELELDELRALLDPTQLT